ncbi:MAG: HAD-IA family hydrolase [Thermoanaerobaculia bacterium]|nr:HAD-IA family hydrolase [Thermoanaerobaculia bacterium]
MTLRYRALIFDLDGTLVDSYEALLHAVNSSLAAHDRAPLTVETLRKFVGEGVEPLLERCFEGSVPHGAHDHFVRVYDEVCCDQSRLLDEVEETLDRLDDLGIAMAVCTNKPTSFSKKILEALDAAKYFSAIVGPDLAGAKKPDARHVLHALDATGHPKEQALFIGDMPIDVLAARSAGLEVAAIPTGSADHAPLAASEPDYMLDRFSEVVELVRSEGPR